MFEFTWPVLLIGLGVWLIVRRLQRDARRVLKGIPRPARREGNNESLYYDSPIARARIFACWLA